MSDTFDLHGALAPKMRLADAIRQTDRARTRVHVAVNNLCCAKVDVAHARSSLTRAREEEAAARRAVRAAERKGK